MPSWNFLRRHVVACFTAAAMSTFLLCIWLLPADNGIPSRWTTQVVRQYAFVASGDQREAHLIVVLLTATFALLALLMARRGLINEAMVWRGPELNLGASLVLTAIGLAAYSFLVPGWLTAWASAFAGTGFLLVFAAPYVRGRAIDGLVIALIGFYLAVLIVPGLLTRPIPLMANDPNALSQFEQHLLLLTMPGRAISSGQKYFAGLPYDYGLIFPSIMSVIDRKFGSLSIGSQLRFVQYAQLVFSVCAVCAYLTYRPRSTIGVLAAMLLAGPYWVTGGLGIWHPNQTGLRSDGFPIGILVLTLASTLRPSRVSWLLGATAGIAILGNLETAVALSAGYVVFLIARTQKFPVKLYLQAAIAAFVAIVLYLALYRLALGRLPFAGSPLDIFAYLRRFLGGGFGLRLFSRGDANVNWFLVPFALFMLAHAIYIIIDGFRMLGHEPLSPRRALRVSVAAMLIVWLAYYFSAPNWWQIWTHLFLYGFLVLEQFDRRYFGLGARPRASESFFGRMHRMRIGLGRCVLLFFLALLIPNTNQQLIMYTRDFMYPSWVRTAHEAVIVSGIALPKDMGDLLQAKARKLDELNEATKGRLTYLTFNMAFMPELSGLFEPDPYRDLWVGTQGDGALPGIMDKLLKKRPEIILVDAPTGPLAVSGERKIFQDRVRDALERDYHVTDTADGWQVWRPNDAR